MKLYEIAGRRLRLLWLLLSGFCAAPALAVDYIEHEAVFQNGQAYHAVSSDVDGNLIRLHINLREGNSQAQLLRFGNLDEQIRGDRIEVLEARLELYYTDEHWSLVKYHVTASRSLDGTAGNIASQAEGSAIVLGDKWPRKQKTPRPSWISIPLKAATVQSWIENDSNNHGLVLHIAQANRGRDQKLVRLKPTQKKPGVFFVGFRSPAAPGDGKTPRLHVRYRIHGNAAPSQPGLQQLPANAEVYREARISWQAATDLNPGDSLHYEFEVGRRDGQKAIHWSQASARIEGNSALWQVERDIRRLYGDVAAGQQLWYRVRAIDNHGAASGWQQAGPVRLATRPWTVWGTHGNHKIWPDILPLQGHGEKISLQAAANEWEPLQVVVMSHAGLSNVRIRATALSDGKGNRIAQPVIYRQHYLPVSDTANRKYGRLGMVPDALVPLYHPQTGKPTGGKYGGDVFDIDPGRLESFWLDIHVPAGTPAGIYHGEVEVSGDGLDSIRLPVEFEVFDFSLPMPRHLVGAFQITGNSVVKSHGFKAGQQNRERNFKLMHDYDEMLHEHFINNWSPVTGYNYGRSRTVIKVEDGQVKVDWSRFDELVGPYMDGSAYRDGVPAQVLFVPYWIPVWDEKRQRWAPRVMRNNYRDIDEDLFAQWIRQLQAHLEEKGWLDRAYVFYFDEPFISAWKYEAFVKTAKIIRREGPKLRILITDGYRNEEERAKKDYATGSLEPYVDVWDPVTFQVNGPDKVAYYRQRKAEGHFDMWCQTLANANPRRAVINLFPEYDMPFHRMWGVMSWNFGFQGIEWWETVIWWDAKARERLDPWTNPVAFPGFRQPLNSDGRLFFPGTPDAIGGPDIPISTLRMKALREAIEDYEYLYLLDQAGRIGDFDIDSLHTMQAARKQAMKQPMPMGKGPWHWWEGDGDVLMQARQKIARLIEQAKAAGQ